MQETIFTKFDDQPADKIYPGGRTYAEYLTDIRESGEMAELESSIAESAQEKFLELGLSGQVWDKTGQPVNLNTYFDRQVFFDERIYTQAKDAYKREQDGTATQDDIDLLTQVRDPDGQVRKRIQKLSGSDPILGQGFESTGGFPRSLFDDEIIVPDEIKQEGVVPGFQIGDLSIETITPRTVLQKGAGFIGLDEIIPNGRNLTEQDAIRRSESIAALQDFLTNNANVPTDPVIRDALDLVLDSDVINLTVERMYNLADVTEETVEHHMPRLFHWATNYNFTSDAFGNLSAENFITDEAVAADLAQVRALSAFADRGKVLNDMLREQVIDIVGQQRFDESIYAEKVRVTYETANGEQVTKEEYRHKFVSDEFAEQFFEAALNSEGFFDRMAVFFLENLAAGGVVRAPFAAVGAVARGVGRGSSRVSFLSSPKLGTAPVYISKDKRTEMARILSADDVKGMNPKDYFTLPYAARYMTSEELGRYTREYADFQGIGFSTAARQLHKLGRAENAATNTLMSLLGGSVTKKGFTARAQSGAADIAISNSDAKYAAEITAAKKGLEEALKVKDGKAVVEFSYQLRSAVAKQNWVRTKSLVKGAREFGFSPGFDTAIAFTQSLNREIFVDNVNNPQFGAMTDFYSAVSVVSLLGAKRMFDIRGGIPFVSSAASSAMYNAKNIAEDTAGFVFASFTRVPTDIPEEAQAAMRAAGAATAYGRFVAPGLRDLLAMSPEEVANLPIATRRWLENFTSGVYKTLSPEDQSAMVDDIQEGIDDLKLVMKPFYQLEEAGIVNKGDTRALEQAIGLNIGQMTGMGLILSIQRQRQVENARLNLTAFSKWKKKTADLFKIQDQSKKQIAAMAASAELIEAQILNLKKKDIRLLNPNEAAKVDKAIENLSLFSQQFKNAALVAQKQFDDMLKKDAQIASDEIDILTNPLNKKLLDRAHASGLLESLLDRISRYEQSVVANRAFVAGVEPQPEFATEMRIGNQIVGDTSADDSAMKVLSVSSKLNQIRDASAGAINLARPYADSASVAAQQSDMIVQIIQRERIDSDSVIKNGYAKVDTTIEIPITGFISSIQKEFQTYSARNDTFLDAVNPTVLETLGGSVGKRFIEDINSAALRSMTAWITPRLDAINGNKKALDGNVAFEDASAYLEFVKKDIINNQPAIKEAMAVGSPDDIDNIQLMLYMINADNLAVSAKDMRLVASPMELETMRQAGNQMLRSSSDATKTVGKQIVNAADNAFRGWATGATVDAYNDVIVARTVYRAEQLRFDKTTTLGGAVEARIGEGQLAGETGVKKDVADLLNPFVDAVRNPKDNTMSKARTELQKLINTLAPINHSLIESKLVKQVDGKYEQLDEKDIENLVERVVDLETYNEMKLVLGNALRNSFYGSSNMSKARSALDRGLIPSLFPDDAPKRIEIPFGQGSVQEYFNTIEEAAIVKVDMKDGKPPVSMKLIDLDELIYADRDITFVVNSTLEFREAHADLVKIINNARTDTQKATSSLEATQKAVTDVQLTLPRNFSGQGFVKNVMFSDEPDAGVACMRQLTTSPAYKSMSPEQQQKATRSLFAQTIKSLGSFTETGNRKVKLFTGDIATSSQYNTPEVAFVALNDGLNSTTQAGVALRQLADAAGITAEQYETLHAIFRMGTKIDAAGVVARSSDGSLNQLTKGFSLDNVLSKAFNLARGMVSKEYVMAEVAIRYAAMSRGKTIDFLLDDPKSAKIVKDLLEDESLVADEDAYYFARQLSKFIADEVPRGLTELEVASAPYLEEYFVEIGALQPVDADTVVFNQ